MERLGVILQDLRTFVSHTSGEEGPADLEAVLRSSVAMTWNEIRHRARLERDVRRVPPVQGSPARLAQVFVNLLANAAQAIPEGDAQSHVIRISAREQPGARRGGGGRHRRRDLARGLPRVFEPFFTTKPAGQGTGLGLSICRSIVHGLGGSLEVKSTPGSGASSGDPAHAPKASAGARPLARAAASIVPPPRARRR